MQFGKTGKTPFTGGDGSPLLGSQVGGEAGHYLRGPMCLLGTWGQAADGRLPPAHWTWRRKADAMLGRHKQCKSK